MSNILGIKQEEQMIDVLSDMVQVYEQLFVEKMQTTRDGVLGTRQYIEGVKDLYNEIRRAYGEEVAQLARTKKPASWFKKYLVGEKEVAVFLTGEGKIGSAEINQRVMLHFLEYIMNHECDIVVIGEWGYKQIQSRVKDRKIHYYTFGSSDKSIPGMREMFLLLQKYANVRVFYGKYVNLVNQSEGETVLGILGDQNKIQQSPGTIPKYTYEPGLQELIEFFHEEIFKSVFTQVSNEAYLSQLGSRISSMEAALSNIDLKRKRLLSQKRRLIKRRKNRKQMQAMSGMSFWSARK